MAKKKNSQVKQEVNEALLSDLLVLYTHAEEAMLQKVAKRVAKGITEEGWNEFKAADTSELRKEISALLHSPSKTAKTKMGKSILKAYKEGVNGVEKEAGKPLTAMSDLNVPLSIQNLLLAHYQLIDDNNAKILRKVEDAYRDTAMEASSVLLAGVETRMQASQRMMDKLAAKGITTFTDKAGRQWDMASYTEMAIRTATAHAALQGRIDTQESLGNDLMQVSTIGATCPICARWQGVVLSISGNTPGYYTVDQAKAAGLFHPNCKHTMVMWDAELDGEGQKELNSDTAIENVVKTYDLTQQQRANERSIRHWKRRAAGAVDPKMKAKYNDRVVQATLKNIMFCEKHGLTRLKSREGVKYPNSSNAQFIDWFGKHLMGYSEFEMAKVILDESTLKQLLKDKSESLTTLYKKYIGENPSQDYKAVGDTQLTYAQWLKAKVMELTQDMPDPQEEQYITIPDKFTEAELKALLKQKSLTEVYKEHIGATPSQDYKNNYTGPLTYAQWLKAQVGDLTMEKVVPVSSMPQNQSEIKVVSGTKPLGDQPLDGAIKQDFDKVFTDLKYEADIQGLLATNPSDIVQGAYWADESLANDMDKQGQAAIIKNGKIYFNPHKQGSIGPNTVYHEMGHLMSVKGLKATTKDFEGAANEIMSELGYNTFKDMAFKLTTYAQTNAQEFFAEAFMLYHSSVYNKLPYESKEIVAAAMKKMYLKQVQSTPQKTTPTPQEDVYSSYAKKGKEAYEEAKKGISSPVIVGFAYALGYEDTKGNLTDFAFDLLGDDEFTELFNEIKHAASTYTLLGLSKLVESDPDSFFSKDFLESIQKKSSKLQNVGTATQNTTAVVNPADLITETDKENFAKAKQIWDDKIAKDGKMGFGTLKTSVAQVFGLSQDNDPDGTKFAPIWDEVKKAVKHKKGPYADVNLTTLTEVIEPLFNGDKLEDFLTFDSSHPVAQAKAKEAAEQAAIAKAKAAAQAAAQAQAMAAAVQAAKGASGFKMGAGSMTEQESDAFIEEHKSHHLSSLSVEGKALDKRLKDSQKKYAKDHFGVTSLSKSYAQGLEAEVAKAVRSGDAATLEKIGPIWALYDYSKASGVYNWYKRGRDRHKSVNSSDHPLGRGMTEWEYGEQYAKLIDKYFENLPPLDEDVYVHRVFGEDALQSLFGLETDAAKQKVDLKGLLSYSKTHPGETIIRDRGYLSTSTFTDGTWNGDCEIKIKLTKGTKAAYLGAVEAHSVNEMLVQSNQKMRVNAIYARDDYSYDEWYKLASEKGFNPSKKVAIFAETIPDDIASVTREAKEIQIGEMLAAQSGRTGNSSSQAAMVTELSNEYNQSAKSWSSSEKSGVRAYTGSDYRWMNTALREGTLQSRSTTDQNKVKNAKAALDKSRTSQDRVYRRGSDIRSLLGMLGEDPSMSMSAFTKKLASDPEYFNSGTRIAFDNGFLSTSPFIDKGFYGDIEYRIFAPAGTKALYVASISQHQSEGETLFQAGAKFRVIAIHDKSQMDSSEQSAKHVDIGMARSADIVVYLEVIPDD